MKLRGALSQLKWLEKKADNSGGEIKETKMIILSEDCRPEDADRLEVQAQAEFPDHSIVALNPVSSREGKRKYPWGRVLEDGETYKVL